MFGLGLKQLLTEVLTVEQARTDRLEKHLTSTLATLDEVRQAYRADLHAIMGHLATQQASVLSQLTDTFTKAQETGLIAMAEVTRSARSCVAAMLANKPDADPATRHLGTVLGLQETMQPVAPQNVTEVPEVPEEPDTLAVPQSVTLLGDPPGEPPIDSAPDNA